MPEWEQLSAVADAVPVPLLGLDAEGRVRLLNAAAAEFLGRPHAGEALSALCDDAQQAADFCAALERNETRTLPLLRGDGVSHPTRLTPRPLPPTGNGRSGWLVTLQEDEGASTADAISRCLESVAHELRGPLTALLGFASLLERDFGERLDSVGRTYLSRLRLNVDRAQKLLERVVQGARVREMEGTRQLVAPHPVFARLADELKDDLEERGIRLVVPESPPPVYASSERLYQVTLNLLSNAIQHMGEVEQPEIRISLETVERGRLLVVSDNGRGIPNADRVRILDLFRSATPRADWRGTGLGLSIVNRIMSAYGGSIEVESFPNRGATFRAFFPDSP